LSTPLNEPGSVKTSSLPRFNWAGVSTSDDETHKIRHIENLYRHDAPESSIQRVAFPKEWDLMLPDRADVIKETWKNAWRRFVFYVFFFALLVYLRHFPAELQTFYTWIWVINILWYDLDLTVAKSNFLVRLLHAPAIVGSFASSVSVGLQLQYDSSFLSNRIQAAGHNRTMAWFLITWMNFLPPVWHMLDLYLHREDLIERHNLRIPLPALRPLKIFRITFQILWNLTSTPILGAVWILFLGSTDSLFFFAPDLSALFFSVNSICNVVVVIVLVYVVRRGKPKQRVVEESFEHSRSITGENESGSDADVHIVQDDVGTVKDKRHSNVITKLF